MRFDFVKERFEANKARLDCFVVPWDSEILGAPVAQIAHFSFTELTGAQQVIDALSAWKQEERVRFSSCRLQHDQLLESFFLQRCGYRFIELNYQPQIKLGFAHSRQEAEFRFEMANDADRGPLADLAEGLFEVGRFHSDPMLGPRVGNSRYRAWMENAFELPHQQVIKCTVEGRVGAFFVVENTEHRSFWSLVGLHPNLQGKGIGKRVWQSMIAWQHDHGVREISTSISSLNTPVLNLYVSLGFRFPPPHITLHWHREV